MLELFISCLVATIVNILFWKKLLNENISFKIIKTYLAIIFMIICLMANSTLVEPILRTIVVLFITLITIEILYGLELKKAIILSIITQLLYIVSEVMVIIILLILTNIQSNVEMVEKFSGTVYTNLAIDTIVFSVSQLTIIKEFYYKVLGSIKSENIQNILIIVLTIVATATILFNLIFFENNLLSLVIVGLFALLVYLIFVAKSINIRNNYLKMYSKYNSTLQTLKSYEDIMDKYKVSNHENKNQLLMIRNMLAKETKAEVGEYIDKIVDNQYKNDENLMMETSKIPSGGLRALIYSKLLYMRNNKIQFDLKVDRKIRNVEFINLDQSLVLDICKVVGVFLDNAIDETKKIKDGSVCIELYVLDDVFHISIANMFEGFIDLHKIDEEKYTTKGDGHGYGLSLVRRIVDSNFRLENIRMINDNVFTQILKIKM